MANPLAVETATEQLSEVNVPVSGTITMIYGPMFSGKTSELISQLNRAVAMKQRVLLICPSRDNRSDNTKRGIISTHVKIPAYVDPSTETRTLNQLGQLNFNEVRNYDVIGIDEAQFFHDIEQVLSWSQLGIAVHAAGLLHTSEGEYFGNYHKLLPFSNHLQLKAICRDCFLATRSKLGYGIQVDAVATVCQVAKKEQILIGSNIYRPVCLRHWFESRSSQAKTENTGEK